MVVSPKTGFNMAKRILIIDDDPDILEVLDVILGEEGYDVKLSKTGEEVEYLQIICPDLVLLDIRISGSPKSGAELCSKIKSDPATKGIPVILVSSEQDIAKIGEKCGANGYIRKPLSKQQLLTKIQEVFAAA
jgi:two-component system response regulator VicR